MHVSENELKEFIIDSGLVARKEIEDAAREAERRGQSIGDILVSRGLLTEDALRRTHAYVLGIPFVSLKGEQIPADVLAIIPEPIARTHNIIAYKKDGEALEVALLDIEDLSSLKSMHSLAKYKIRPRLTDTESIRHTLLSYQRSLKDEFGDTIASEAGKIHVAHNGERSLSAEDRKRIAEDLSVVRIVDALLRHAIVQHASDIHIEPMEREVFVRYRIGGRLHDAIRLPKATAMPIATRVRILANVPLEETGSPQDGRFRMETEGDRVSFRVSTLPTSFGEKVVLRLLREAGEGFTLDVLGFHGEHLEHVHEALRERSGLILVSGPARSGKTTTLYTMLDILNVPQVSIATIEDPVEYQLKRVSQSQVNPSIGFTFQNGLRALMRQDPDILMVGEVRDGETALLAVNAARAGRLVLCGLSAESAAEAVGRLLDMGIDPHLLASTLRVSINQRLAYKLCAATDAYTTSAGDREAVAPSIEFDKALSALKDEKLVASSAELDDIPFYKPAPTAECPDGYKGHAGIQEVLFISPSVRESISRAETKEAIEAHAVREGMLTLAQDFLYKAARGFVSLSDLKRILAR